jgi:hypothetical protein
MYFVITNAGHILSKETLSVKFGARNIQVASGSDWICDLGYTASSGTHVSVDNAVLTFPEKIISFVELCL